MTTIDERPYPTLVNMHDLACNDFIRGGFKFKEEKLHKLLVSFGESFEFWRIVVKKKGGEPNWIIDERMWDAASEHSNDNFFGFAFYNGPYELVSIGKYETYAEAISKRGEIESFQRKNERFYRLPGDIIKQIGITMQRVAPIPETPEQILEKAHAYRAAMEYQLGLYRAARQAETQLQDD
jgi:hypothetical protein